VPRDEFGLPESMELLEALEEKDVLAAYNHWAGVSTSLQRPELLFWRTEWEYRRQRKVAATMERMTRRIFGLTVVVAVCTVLVAVFTAVLYFR
jgi:hypothetical protein